MIIAEFTYASPRLTRVYDTVTGADVNITPEVHAMASTASYGAISTIVTKHNSVDVGYEIKESK